MAYPDSTVGSLSSSGVVNPILDFTAFDEKVTRTRTRTRTLTLTLTLTPTTLQGRRQSVMRIDAMKPLTPPPPPPGSDKMSSKDMEAAKKAGPEYQAELLQKVMNREVELSESSDYSTSSDEFSSDSDL